MDQNIGTFPITGGVHQFNEWPVNKLQFGVFSLYHVDINSQQLQLKHKPVFINEEK